MEWIDNLFYQKEQFFTRDKLNPFNAAMHFFLSKLKKLIRALVLATIYI